MKNQLSLAIALALATTTTIAAPTLYGEIDLSLDYVAADNAAPAKDRDITDLNSNNSFIGLKGNEKLTDRLSALYQAELTFYTDAGASSEGSGDTFVPRNLLIGLKDEQLGTIKVGKIDTPVKQLSSVVDTFNNYVANNADIHGIMGGETRLDNVVVYEAPSLAVGAGKIDAKVQLATGENNKTIKATKGGFTTAGRGLGDTWSSSVVYTDKTFVAGVGYDKAVPTRFLSRGFLNAEEREVNAASNVAAEANTIRAIGRVNLDNGLSLRALYQTSEVKNAHTSANAEAAENIDDAQAWLVGAEYVVPNTAWTVKGQYSQNVVSFKNTKSDYEVNQILAGADYAFTKQVKLYGHAGYLTIEQGSKEDTQVLVGTGFEYKF